MLTVKSSVEFSPFRALSIRVSSKFLYGFCFGDCLGDLFSPSAQVRDPSTPRLFSSYVRHLCSFAL